MASELIDNNGYGQWTRELLASDWAAHDVTLMFAPIVGSPESKISEINKLTARFYSSLCVHSARHPSRQKWLLPRAWFWFGMPGASRQETALLSLTRNTGLFVRGIVFTNPASRLRCSLEEHIGARHWTYCERCKIEQVFVKTLPGASCWDYVIRRLSSPEVDHLPVMIFPCSRSEMRRDKLPTDVGANARRDVQAAGNLSDETAEAFLGDLTRSRAVQRARRDARPLNRRGRRARSSREGGN
jgi:hypothetical protein